MWWVLGEEGVVGVVCFRGGWGCGMGLRFAGPLKCVSMCPGFLWCLMPVCRNFAILFMCVCEWCVGVCPRACVVV